MALNTRTTATEILKLVYEPNMNESIRALVFLFGALSKGKVDGRGKSYNFATHLARNTTVAARGPDDYLEVGQTETVKNGSVSPAYVHIPFEISADLMEASRGDAHAFVEGMTLVQSSAREMMKRELNRMAAGDGRGICATLATTDAGGAGTRTLVFDSTKYFEQGMRFDVYNGAAGTTPRNTVTGPWFEVVAVLDDTQASFKMSDGSALPATTANDVWLRKGNSFVSGTRQSYEPNGLRLMADDGTLDPSGGLHGISAASYYRWKGINKDGTGFDASPALVSAMAIQFRRWSSTFFNTIWCHDNQAHGLLYGGEGSYKDKRFVNSDPTDLGASYEDVVINVSGQKVKIKVDLDLPEDTIYFFDSKVMGYAELWPVKLLEQADGLYLTPWRDNLTTGGQKLAQVGFYGWSGNFFTRVRNGIGRVYGLNKPASLPW